MTRRNNDSQVFSHEDGLLGISIRKGGGFGRVPSTFWPGKFGLKRGLYGQHGKLARCGRLLVEGLSIREASRQSGICNNTARLLLRGLESMGIRPACPCGTETRGHPTWCWWRRRRSANRAWFESRVFRRYGVRMDDCLKRIRAGQSIRAAAKAAGVSRHAATRLAKELR